MKKHKVAIYIRVSTKKQVEEGYSLDAQRERLEKICETAGYIIYKVYADEGKSGKDTNRPAFQKMMQDMKEGKFDKILVMKLDRISRSVIDLEIMIKEMQTYKVEFESASEKIDTSSSFGMMFVRLLAIFAQFERERISERINDTFETMVQEARAITGNQPFGYKVDNGKVIIDEDKKEIVEYIFDTYEKYHSIKKTLMYTNEKFNTKLLYNLLTKTITNTMYYGSYRNNDNYCPAYISKERFDRIQKIYEEHKNIKVYNISRVYLFSGLLIDMNCNCKLSGNTAHANTNYEILSYRCNLYRKNGLCISNRSINQNKLEKYLIDNLDNLLIKFFEKKELEYKNDKINYKDNSKKIAEIKAEMKRTTNSYNKGRMEEDEYDKEYEKLEKQLAKLQAAPVKKDISHLKDLTKIDWKTMYNELTPENKQAFWRRFIKKIEIDPNNYLKFNEEYIRVYFNI